MPINTLWWKETFLPETDLVFASTHHSECFVNAQTTELVCVGFAEKSNKFVFCLLAEKEFSVWKIHSYACLVLLTLSNFTAI